MGNLAKQFLKRNGIYSSIVLSISINNRETSWKREDCEFECLVIYPY